MWDYRIVFAVGCILQVTVVHSGWQCSSDLDCASITGSSCVLGECSCQPGHQSILGGSICSPGAPYFGSSCVEDHQCSRLITRFECRKTGDSQEGNCRCQEGNHFVNGRCWPTIDYEQPCHRDEECVGALLDPFSLKCDGVCVCADGYYFRQRGECRKIGYAVGDGCVLDQDCQFTNGACDINTFSCYNDVTGVRTQPRTEPATANATGAVTRQLGLSCDVTAPCPDPLVCYLGACACPVGYYANEAGTMCLANLGSPSTSEQCVGFLAEVRDGICNCPVNFYYENNMIDCIKVTRRPTDACATDEMCHTFGAASRCSEPLEPWFFQQCECVPERAVWDEAQQMCRLFVGIGEECETNADCIAGDMEILCAINGNGPGVCVCPEGFVDVNGLCLTSGLQLGDSCQATSECTETEHTVCSDGTCSCGPSYQEMDGVCLPKLGGLCQVNENCIIDNSICVSETREEEERREEDGIESEEEYEEGERTCQCASSFVDANDLCWPMLPSPGEVLESSCDVTEQCQALLGNASSCTDNKCLCDTGYHYRDEGCWPQIGLFETCARTSECYLEAISDRVVCRNSLCQCSFDHPYSEQLHTCGDPNIEKSSAMTISKSIAMSLFTLYLLV